MIYYRHNLCSELIQNKPKLNVPTIIIWVMIASQNTPKIDKCTSIIWVIRGVQNKPKIHDLL